MERQYITQHVISSSDLLTFDVEESKPVIMLRSLPASLSQDTANYS